MKTGHDKFMENIKDSYRTAALAITIATNTRDHTDHRKWPWKINRSTQFCPCMRKLNDDYDGLYQLHTFRTIHNSNN